MATLLSCADPTRPVFPGTVQNDSTPPNIQFIAPPPSDTIVAGGSTVNVSIQVSDRKTVAAITCDVTGAVAFSFPVVAPQDTMASVTFPVPTRTGGAGRVDVTVVATDAAGNSSSKTFAFVVR